MLRLPQPPLDQRARAYERHLRALDATQPTVDCAAPASAAFARSGGGKRAAMADAERAHIQEGNAKLLRTMAAILSRRPRMAPARPPGRGVTAGGQSLNLGARRAAVTRQMNENLVRVGK